MLRKIYVDNFKCLSNFEWNLGNLSVLFGENGSGKTSVMDAIRAIRDLICGKSVSEIFSQRTLTRWQKNNIQTFSIELEKDNELFTYTLIIEYSEDHSKVRIQSETLSVGGQPIFEMKTENNCCDIQLYRDNFSRGPCYSHNWDQSGMFTIPERNDNKKLSWFKNQIASIFCLKINPFAIDAECSEESDSLNDDASNFVAWYRFASQAKQGELIPLFECLSKVLYDFRNLQLDKTGLFSKILRVANEGKLVFDFSELSDGQKVLLVLYSLLFLRNEEASIIFLDEPDNFVALREIQPFLMKVNDLVEDQEVQVILISHSAEVIDMFGPSYGYLTYRTGNAATRIRKLEKEESDSTLLLSEQVARGWTE